MEDLRKSEKLIDGIWEGADFESIKIGDTFRLFESTGEPVLDKAGNSNFIANSNIYVTKNGVCVVNIKGGDSDE